MLFAKMGIPNDQLAFFTTLLYFPWFLKGLWSPFVDIFRTKRWWVVTMQAVMTALCILLTLTLPRQGYFGRTVPVDADSVYLNGFCLCHP